jgi:ribonuclease Z
LFEIIFLGTSASAPSIQRGLSAQVVIHNEHRFLIDCGEGTQRQILQSGLGFKRLEHVLITHSHLDHILGLAGLVSTLMRWETIPQLEIWAGRGAMDRIRDLLWGVVLKGERDAFDLRLVEIEPGMVFENRDFTVTAVPVQHRGPGNLGFVFQEKSRRPFLVERAEALGVPAGPIRRRLVAGEVVTLPDGRTVGPEDVLGEVTPGARLAHIGDCGDANTLLEAVRGADALVMEATYLEVEADMARRFGHLTAAQAASLARAAGVGRLYLTHVSRRYREREVREEARSIFPDTTIVRDFDHYLIQRGRAVPAPREALAEEADAEAEPPPAG